MLALLGSAGAADQSSAIVSSPISIWISAFMRLDYSTPYRGMVRSTPPSPPGCSEFSSLELASTVRGGGVTTRVRFVRCRRYVIREKSVCTVILSIGAIGVRCLPKMSVVTAHRRVETPHARCLRLVRPPLRSGERELKGTFVVGRAAQRVVWATGRSAAAAHSAHRLHVCPPRAFVGGSDGRGELSIPTRLATSSSRSKRCAAQRARAQSA